ncbi:hypothetical protein [Pseudomonas sp. W15Feb34]|uniref:hypothetical protein n=1 Tax=Pseudomonas sp. W15Feb34 TaxID=550727 RepID=UPI002005CEB9|nr:hypothetical protein [Pseudomonas sp. W15Feb34]MCK3844450.1 hypothetical protein [Pseudomonas sp. W15Feb34]
MISKELSVYNLNSFVGGRKIQLPYEKQIELIGNELLEKNADINVLPEFNDSMLSSGLLRTVPERAETLVSTTVKQVVSVPTDFFGSLFGSIINLIPDIPIISTAKSLVIGATKSVLDTAVGVAGDVAGGVVKLGASLAVPVFETIGAIRPIGSALEHVSNTVLSAVGVREFQGVPLEGLIIGDHGRLKDITNYMNSKLGDDVYSYTLHGGTGTISKYKIMDEKPNGAAGGSSLVIDYDKDGAISSRDIHLDTIHTNDLKYAAYLPRGISGDGPTPNQITTDTSVIKAVNLASGRTEAINNVLNAHANGPYKDLAHIVSGDFNEPSHLDWIASNKNANDRNGVVYEWDTSKALIDKGYTDSFREVHPDPVKDPGHTWGGPAYETGNKSWAPTVDDRDRIDMTYSQDGNKIDLTSIKATVVGSNQYFVKDGLITQASSNSYDLSSNPTSAMSDHKGLMTTYLVNEIPTVGQPSAELS